MIDFPAPAVAEREEPMRREALAEVARQATVAHDRSRREAADRVARRTALALIAEEARRKAADERVKREALQEIARRAAAAEAYHRQKAEEERARLEALDEQRRRAAAAAEERARREAEEARELGDIEQARRRAEAELARASATDTQPVDHESTTRLVDALARLQTASDTVATRLEQLTWALVLLSVLIVIFTIAVLVKG